jgi:hypothetical protein
MTRARWRLLLLASSAATSALLAPRTAFATVGADLDLALPIDSKASTGWGVGLRLGKELHIPALALMPEIYASYYHFGGTFGTNLVQGKAGARLSIGELIRPGAFAHIGGGYNVPDIGDNKFGLAFDTGLFLDFTPIPLMNVGIHGAYNYLSVGARSGDITQWMTIGAHADFIF